MCFRKTQTSDAILLGAVGGPNGNPYFREKARKGLLKIRKDLIYMLTSDQQLFFPHFFILIKPEIISGLDLMIIRELLVEYILVNQEE